MSLALASIALVWTVVSLVLAVPVSAATASPARLSASVATSFADRALGAPGPMHGASVSSPLRNVADARFGPTTPVRGATTLSPGCSSSSCPMGETDYGITPTGTSYTYNAATMGAYADVSVLKIGAATGGGCLDIHAVHCMTIQQNSVVNGVMVQNQRGQYWAQDVPEVSLDGVCSAPCVSHAYSVTWLDNIWNFTGTSSTLNAANMAGNLTGKCSSSAVGVAGTQNYWYCVGPTDYGLTLPFTIWALTSVGPNANAFYGGCPGTPDSCIQFWGAIFEGSTEPYFGWFDQVDFTAGTLGGGHPMIHVANASTPYGLPYDAEWVMGGPGGGSAAAVTNSNVMMQSEYNTGVGSVAGSNPGTWQNVRHAWSSGADTAEAVSNVYMVNYFGARHLASATKGPDNSGTSLW